MKASPCSIGFAGREAADNVAPFDERGAAGQQHHLERRRTSRTWRPAARPVYPLARKLWFNSFQDPIVGFLSPNLTAAELGAVELHGPPRPVRV